MKKEVVGVEDFEKIYDAYVSEVLNKVTGYTHNREKAYEITQSAFLQFYTHHKDVDDEKARQWIHKTARNLAFNDQKRSKREYLDAEIQKRLDGYYQEQSAEEQVLEKVQADVLREFREEIFERLHRKNPKWYEAISLIYVLEKPQKIVAEEMGMDLESLHSMVYRAKRWIRETYKERFDEFM